MRDISLAVEIFWALPKPALAGGKGKELRPLPAVQGNPWRSVKGCPALRTSMLSCVAYNNNT